MPSGVYKRTPEMNAKMSISRKGIPAKNKGIPMSPEQKLAISNSRIGKYCGVDNSTFKDLKGQRFGSLLIIEHAGFNSKNKSLWLCLCDCGNQKTIPGAGLTKGTTTSCGHKKSVSNSEKVFLDGLEKAWGIEIERQKEFPTERGLRKFDGLVKGTQLLIECDGEYYHRTHERRENDIFKEKVANSWGYAVLHFNINDVKAAKKLLQVAQEQ